MGIIGGAPRQRVRAAAVVLAVGVVIFTGCASAPVVTNDDPPIEEPERVETPAVSTPSTEPEVTASLAAASFTDEDGFVWDFVLDAASTTATADLANAQPGEANIDLAVTATATVTNRTSGRNAMFDLSYLHPVWPADSPACTAVQNTMIQAFSTPESYCMITPGAGLFTFLPESDSLAEGESTLLSLGGNPRTFTVPEAEADATTASLQSPAGYVFWPVKGAEPPLGACELSMSGVPIAAATFDPGC